MTTNTKNPTIILIAGYWLGAWAWDEVCGHLTAAGGRTLPLTLPGLDASDPRRASRTLDDQVAAVEQAIAEVSAAGADSVVIVAHSGANAPVSLVLDRDPGRVSRIVWVDSGPVTSGTAFAPDAPAELVELPLPPFDELAEHASIDGLTAEMLERFRERAVPEPGPVVRQRVELTDEARWAVPTTLVCTSISSAQIRELADGGHPLFAEVANLSDVELIDLPTGHWPMWSRPDALAGIIADAASSSME
ncbi:MULTISPECIES: alpha/beta hydrolase [Gordonia]|uniref:alpha/beta fold hydrolase n=1 Tax=Gordonia TaxID=2053 RepID=UPI0032639E90